MFTDVVRPLARVARHGRRVIGVTGSPLREAASPMLRLPRSTRHAVAEVESIRAAMLADTSVLIDGSLGDGGIWDRGHTVAEVARVSKDRWSARTLLAVAATLHPTTVLEFGTNVGISSAYLAIGAGEGGTVTTLESSPYRSRLAGRVHSAAGVVVDRRVGMFDDILDDVLTSLPAIDLAFIDGNHEYEPTMRYVHAIQSHGAAGLVIILDDIRWSAGMRRAWTEIACNHEVVDLGDMGLCLNRQPRNSR